MQLKRIQDAHIKGRRVLLRVDMNVPVDKRGRIIDDFRIRKSLPTIRWVLAHGGTLSLITHRGSPLRARAEYSVAPIVEELQKLLHRKIFVVRDPVHERPESYPHRVIFLENIRFWPGELKNNSSFAKAIARWGDIYVNDAFAESHRAVASIIGIPRLLPSYAGLLLQKEIDHLGSIFKKPKRPFLVIIGGAKISTKIPYIHLFLRRADHVFLGGALFNTLLAAKGGVVGHSIVEKSALGAARRLWGAKNLILPRDVKVLHSASRNLPPVVRAVNDVEKSDYICDIGPASVQELRQYIKRAGTVLWNGPLGEIERLACREGSLAVARALSESRAVVVIGGGDLEALWRAGRIGERRVHASTGGGALLDFVVDSNLPGINALIKSKHSA